MERVNAVVDVLSLQTINIWFVRRNKAHDDGKQFEVVHDWGGDVISEETMEIVSRHSTELEAKTKADGLTRNFIAKLVVDAIERVDKDRKSRLVGYEYTAGLMGHTLQEEVNILKTVIAIQEEDTFKRKTLPEIKSLVERM
jgi:hypothetical protein